MSRVLVVNNEELAEKLRKERFDLKSISNGANVVEEIEKESPQVVILNEDKGGLDLLPLIRDVDKDLKILITTSKMNVRSAVIGIRYNVTDYLSHKEIKKIKDRLREIIGEPEVKEFPGLGEIIGESPKMKDLFKKIIEAAETDSTVFIQGESGTGKELIARTIHKYSKRRDKPFVPVNCGAIVPTLLESELFGYVKGAFSGALKDKKGLFREADGGTLFLDEVLELPPDLQIKLLRVLQEGEVRPVGSEKVYKVDVRLIAATNRNIERALLSGKLREDFFYRLYVIPIIVPPLRERKEDIPLLIRYFIWKFNQRFEKKKTGITDDALEILLEYNYPGNVRELENIIERAFALGRGDKIDKDDLPEEVVKKVEPRLVRVEREELTDRQEQILSLLRKSGRIKTGDLRKIFPNLSDKTIRKELVELERKGYIIKFGKTRDSYYTLKKREFYSEEKGKISELSKRQRILLDMIREKGVCTMHDFRNKIRDVSERTLRNDLQKLVKLGLIKRTGTTKNSQYFPIISE